MDLDGTLVVISLHKIHYRTLDKFLRNTANPLPGPIDRAVFRS